MSSITAIKSHFPIFPTPVPQPVPTQAYSENRISAPSQPPVEQAPPIPTGKGLHVDLFA